MQREAVQAIDEKLSKMGKLGLVKGQPVYLADKAKKRKKPQESDQGDNTTKHVEKVKKPRKPRKPRNMTTMQIDSSSAWKVVAPNHGAQANPPTWVTIPALPPIAYATTMASGSKGPGTSSTDPLRPAKKARVSTFSTFPPSGDTVCPLCGGPKHRLGDCLIPKGGVAK
jgi:hypothetical protein